MTEDGRTIRFLTNLQATTNNKDEVVIVRLPADGLAYGDYAIKLTGLTSEGTTTELAKYYFRIARK